MPWLRQMKFNVDVVAIPDGKSVISAVIHESTEEAHVLAGSQSGNETSLA